MYRAEVKATNGDGSRLDVQPENPKIPPAQGVPVRVGIPGATALIQPGGIVLIGWENGDPNRPYCVPSWENGATVMKLVFNGQTVILGSESGADFVALSTKVMTELNKIASTFNSHIHIVTGTGVAPGAPLAATVAAPASRMSPSPVAATNGKAS